jgi:hypothetical protein
MEEGTHPCRPLTSRTEESVSLVRDAIHGDRRTAIREVAAQIGTSYGTCLVALIQGVRILKTSHTMGHNNPVSHSPQNISRPSTTHYLLTFASLDFLCPPKFL